MDISTGFERSLLKQSRVYIVILITDVKDQILKNTTWYLILQLEAYPTPNMYQTIKAHCMRMGRMQISTQTVTILSLISSNEWILLVPDARIPLHRANCEILFAIAAYSLEIVRTYTAAIVYSISSLCCDGVVESVFTARYLSLKKGISRPRVLDLTSPQ